MSTSLIRFATSQSNGYSVVLTSLGKSQIIVLYLFQFKEFQHINVLIEFQELISNHEMTESKQYGLLYQA